MIIIIKASYSSINNYMCVFVKNWLIWYKRIFYVSILFQNQIMRNEHEYLILGVMHDVFLSKAIMANKYTRSLILLVGWKKNKSLDS